ncbi:Rab geranylgeranyltransferase [Agyrium rufum]|nr:Rab geranylgeranyltransferase [Agyrium rufum]
MSHGVPRVGDIVPKTEAARQKEQKDIIEYQDLDNAIREKVHRGEYTPEVLQLTSKLLKQNPEYYTLWNNRRRILLDLFTQLKQGDVTRDATAIADYIDQDLQFLIPLLLKYPKCYWIWNHRQWLLQEAIKQLEPATARKFWEQEFGLVSKMLVRDNRNFHGWSYRRKVVEALESPELSPTNIKTSLAQEEFDYTTRMIKAKLSNFSAWHNRGKLAIRLLTERNANDRERREFLDKGITPCMYAQPDAELSAELSWIQDALFTDPYNQSLWFYHEILATSFDPDTCSKSITPNLSLQEQISCVSAEIDTVIEMLEGGEDCKWIYQTLIRLSELYQKIKHELPPQAINEMVRWKAELQKLDPLRRDRWRET